MQQCPLSFDKASRSFLNVNHTNFPLNLLMIYVNRRGQRASGNSWVCPARKSVVLPQESKTNVENDVEERDRWNGEWNNDLWFSCHFVSGRKGDGLPRFKKGMVYFLMYFLSIRLSLIAQKTIVFLDGSHGSRSFKLGKRHFYHIALLFLLRWMMTHGWLPRLWK